MTLFWDIWSKWWGNITWPTFWQFLAVTWQLNQWHCHSLSEWLSEWVSQWQGHLLSCQVTAKNCQNVGQVMFPQRSGSLGWLFNVKKQKVAQSVSHSLSDKVTYWAVRWQLKMSSIKCHQQVSQNAGNQKVAHSVSEWVSDKVTYWAVRWQLKTW